MAAGKYWTKKKAGK